MKRSTSWIHLCSSRELHSVTLVSGQAFRWKKIEDGLFRGPLGPLLVSLRWANDAVEFDYEPRDDTHSETRVTERLRDYFRLDKDLAKLMQEWNRRDAHFSRCACEGLRQLRQDPFETLMSFICSQNNNVARISGMIDRLCSEYGSRIVLSSPEDVVFAFPTLQQMQTATEQRLRELGFGYRAPYICGAVKFLCDKPADFLLSLREKPLDECRDVLTQISGVGLKVADCVALFSLDKLDAVPVDTHVWNVANERYLSGVEGLTKTLTPKTYKLISKHLTDTWGNEAGWAHTHVFCARMLSGGGRAKRKK